MEHELATVRGLIRAIFKGLFIYLVHWITQEPPDESFRKDRISVSVPELKVYALRYFTRPTPGPAWPIRFAVV